MSALEGAIATTRFSMGARPGEIAAASGDPRGWLKAQITSTAAIVPQSDLLPARDIISTRLALYEGRRGKTAEPFSREEFRAATELQRESLKAEGDARLAHAASTRDGFAERWARFWGNHFTVAVRDVSTTGLVGPFEREAIRPHVFGPFVNLLKQATFHPGMLIYLDAFRSIGPSTKAGQNRNAGFNENLAREIMELHTLGVGSGYTQDDIVAFAKALTGWSIEGMAQSFIASARPAAAPRAADGDAVFLPGLHEPGPRDVLGKRYAEDGAGQAGAILADLARHPATARHIATKLARHFVSDDPPLTAVAKLEAAYNKSDGDLAVLARAVIDLDEAWNPAQKKFKTPEEMLVSILRAAEVRLGGRAQVRTGFGALAQRTFGAPSPAGWEDTTAAWASPDSIGKRLEWANALSRRMEPGLSPGAFLDHSLGVLAQAHTRTTVAQAESAKQGFTLAIMSPEFQRR